jgi:hypothetical protein
MTNGQCPMPNEAGCVPGTIERRHQPSRPENQNHCNLRCDHHDKQQKGVKRKSGRDTSARTWGTFTPGLTRLLEAHRNRNLEVPLTRPSDTLLPMRCRFQFEPAWGEGECACVAGGVAVGGATLRQCSNRLAGRSDVGERADHGGPPQRRDAPPRPTLGCVVAFQRGERG